MSSTTTFGDFPGVKVQTAGGAITGVVVGRTQKLVLFGEADVSNGSANANDPTQIRSRQDADRTFGDGSELAENMKDALSNGANIDYLYGVALDITTGNTETISGSSSGTLSNAPIIEGSISAAEDTSSDGNYDTTLTVNEVYESPSASDSDTVEVNPLTGEWDADSSGDYKFTYDFGDWGAAFDAADGVISEDETGIYGSLSEAETVTSTLSGKVNTLRKDYKMIRAVAPVQPNSTSSDGTPTIDTANYSDNIDNDAVFLFGPTREADTGSVLTGAVGGLFAGNTLTEPIYNNTLSGFTEIQHEFTKSEADDLRDEEVMPIRNVGSVRLRDNLSTSTETDWTRDFWRRRIVDQTILVAKQVGESIFGRINNPETRETAEELISVELSSLASDGLIQPNTSDETNWYVDVYDVSSDEVGIDLGIAPFGIVKRVDVSIMVDT